jgi:diguanylate cyclase (GGDEF)-like protein
MNPERVPASRPHELPLPRPGLWARCGDWALRHPWWLVGLLIVTLTAAPPTPLQRLDLLAFDALAGDVLKWLPVRGAKLPGAAPADDVVVAIDDASLRSIGRWPWSRRQHAQLIDRLREAGAAVIVYDVPFTEPATDPQDDEVLARALVRHHHVILPVQGAIRSGLAGQAVLEPTAPLAQAAAALAHGDLPVDADGRVRRFHLGARSAMQRWDSMPRAAWRLQRGERLPTAEGPLSTRDQEIAQARAPWSLEEEALPVGDPPAPRQLSAAQVLNDRRAAAPLAGSTVWVGLTASGLAEPAMPAQADRPAPRVAWLARAHQALERGALVRASSLGERLAAALAPLLVALLVVRSQPGGRWHGGRLLGLAALPVAVSLVGLTLSQMWLPPGAAVLGWLLGYGLLRTAHLRDTRDDLQRTRGHAAATLRAISDGVITVDADHRVLYMNPVAWRFAHNTSPVDTPSGAGLSLTQLMRLSDDDHRRLAQAIDSSLAQHTVVPLPQPLQVQTLTGLRLVRLTVSPVVDAPADAAPESAAATRLDGAVLVLNDVTDSVRAAERLHHEATHDTLTGLPNRVTLTAQFEAALAQARERGEQLALLFIDIDRLKRINDGLGHQQGDAVIRRIADRLRAACPAGSVVARWGGDEFVVLAPDRGDRRDADRTAQDLIHAVNAGIELADMQVHCSCSIGVALAPEQGHDLDLLLTHADAALRRAKLHGGGRHLHATPAASRQPDAPGWTRDALAVENRLRRALAEGALELHYQPQLDVASAEPVGFEALLRWRQLDGQLWSPAQFLDVAEESGLILEIGTWVVREATQQLARWGRLGVPLVPVSVNVSARQCLDRKLVQVVSEALSAEGIPASLLKLEVTETTAMTDVEQVRHLLHELRALGVGVAVDDFGTGYSSLAHLQRLPIDQIKIDQSFVRDIANDHQGAAIVRATIALAHELGVPVVAEGVEDETQLTFLTLHRCDIVQGYYYARPMSGDAAARFMLDAQRAAGANTQPMLALN